MSFGGGRPAPARSPDHPVGPQRMPAAEVDVAWMLLPADPPSLVFLAHSADQPQLADMGRHTLSAALG